MRARALQDALRSRWARCSRSASPRCGERWRLAPTLGPRARQYRVRVGGSRVAPFAWHAEQARPSRGGPRQPEAPVAKLCRCRGHEALARLGVYGTVHSGARWTQACPADLGSRRRGRGQASTCPKM
eukprot:5119885-Pleurochrysis_carterae.AAC.1